MPEVTTGRLALPYPDLPDQADVPSWLSQLVTRLEAVGVALYAEGAVRPTSTSGSPGVQGRWFRNTGTNLVSYDYGTGWIDFGTVTQQQLDDTSFANALIFGG